MKELKMLTTIVSSVQIVSTTLPAAFTSNYVIIESGKSVETV